MSKRSKTLLNVPAFGYTFLLLNRSTGISYPFDTLSQVIRYARPYGVSNIGDIFSSSHSLLSVDARLNNSDFWTHKPKGPPFFLSNHLGAPVSFTAIEVELNKWKNTAYRYQRKDVSRDKRRDMLDQRLIKTKNSSHKIKTNYQKTWESSYLQSFLELQNKKVGMYRHIKTLNERRFNEAHCDVEMQEDGATGILVRASRNKLPTYWDDTCVSIHHSQNSWKHHSKRERQYKAK